MPVEKEMLRVEATKLSTVIVATVNEQSNMSLSRTTSEVIGTARVIEKYLKEG